jgi:hypothetical protein
MVMMLPSLREMFPDHNKECLQSALETSDFKLSRAIGIILEGLDRFTVGSPN